MTLMTNDTNDTFHILTYKSPENIWWLQIKFVPLRYEKNYSNINRNYEHDHADGKAFEERHAAHRGDHRRPRGILSIRLHRAPSDVWHDGPCEQLCQAPAQGDGRPADTPRQR